MNIGLSVSKFFLYLVPFSVVIVYAGTLFPFIVGKGIFMRVAVELALLFFVWAWAQGEITSKEIKARFSNPIVIAVVIFVAIFIIAGVVGVNPSASFWSGFERGEGGFQMIHYGIFFLLLVATMRDRASWRRMFINSLWAAGLMIAYGIAAALKVQGFIGPSLCERFQGSLGNSAYVGTYLIFGIFYAAYLLLEEKKQEKKWIWTGLIGILFCFLVLNQTRGAFLGFGTAVIAGLGYMLTRHPSRKARGVIAGIAVALMVLGIAGFIFRQSITVIPFCGTGTAGGGSRIFDFSPSGESFQTRLVLWEQSIEAFKERPLLGWGPENFSIAFEKYFDPYHKVWFDRAHNIFFDYLVFAGLAGLLSFIAIFAVLYGQFFRKIANSHYAQKKKGETIPETKRIYQDALLFAVPIAYLVQGLVLFDVLPIYINLFLVLAFMVYKSKSAKENE